MSERRLLMNVEVVPCGCNLQVWVDGTELHIGACCPSCEQVAVQAIHKIYPELLVREVY